SLVSGRACAQASRPTHSKHLQAASRIRLNGETVAPHFPSAEVRAASAAMVRSAISKTKMAEYFHSGFATPLRLSPNADSRQSRDREACKNILRRQTADASPRRCLPDVRSPIRLEAGSS